MMQLPLSGCASYPTGNTNPEVATTRSSKSTH